MQFVINPFTGKLDAVGMMSITPTPMSTIDGDTGSATGAVIAFNATPNSGSSVEFAAGGSTVDLLVTDANTNTIIGKNAGNGSITGNSNTGLGDGVFAALTSGVENTAIGKGALATMSVAGANTAVGYQAGTVLTGFPNTLIGFKAGTSLTTADNNTAVGYEALNSVIFGTDNIAIGHLAGSDYTGGDTDNIAIGNVGIVGESDVIRIGTDQTECYVAGISGATPTSANTPQVTLCDNAGNLTTIDSGTAAFVLTSNGTATPSFQAAAAGGITTIDGDAGSVTGSTVTISGGTTGLTTSGASTTLDLTGTLVVANGGTGDASFTAYAPVCGGTTTTGALQSASTGIGTAGFVLTSNGASSLPTFQAAGGGGAGSKVLIQSQTANSASITFTSGFGGYSYYILEYFDLVANSSNIDLYLNISTDGGATYVSTDYDFLATENYQAVGTIATYNQSAQSGFLLQPSIGDASGASTDGYVNIYSLDSSSIFKKILFNSVSTRQGQNTSLQFTGSGTVQTSAVVNALNLNLDIGAFTSGTVRLFGVL